MKQTKKRSQLEVYYGVKSYPSNKVNRTPLVSLALMLRKDGQEILLSSILLKRPIGIEHGDRFIESLRSGIEDLVMKIPTEHRFLYDRIAFRSGRFYNPHMNYLERAHRLPAAIEDLIKNEVIHKIQTV